MASPLGAELGDDVPTSGPAPIRSAWAKPVPERSGSAGEMRDAIGPGARVLRTAHFLIAHTVDVHAARLLAQRLEAVYRAHARFVSNLALPVRPPPNKLEVYYLATHEQYGRVVSGAIGRAATEALGLYAPASNRAAFFDLTTYSAVKALREELSQCEPGRRERLQQRLERRLAVLMSCVIQHEAAHQIQRNTGLIPAEGGTPMWLVEGMAMLFEGPIESSDDLVVPYNGYRLHEFRKIYGRAAPSLDEVRRFVSDDRAWGGGTCYPLAWALTHHLLEEHRKGFVALLTSLTTGDGLPPVPSARLQRFEALFGPLNDRWLEDFYESTMSLRVRESVFED